MTHGTCGTYATRAECLAEGTGHAIAQTAHAVGERCPGCPEMSRGSGHARRPGCPDPKTRVRDIRHPEAPGPDIPEAPPYSAHSTPLPRPGQLPRQELRRAPGASRGLFQRDLTGGVR